MNFACLYFYFLVYTLYLLNIYCNDVLLVMESASFSCFSERADFNYVGKVLTFLFG